MNDEPEIHQVVLNDDGWDFAEQIGEVVAECPLCGKTKTVSAPVFFDPNMVDGDVVAARVMHAESWVGFHLARSHDDYSLVEPVDGERPPAEILELIPMFAQATEIRELPEEATSEPRRRWWQRWRR